MTLLPEIATQGETMEVNGVAHIFLTASNYERSRDFYRELLPFLGLKPVIDTETTYYCVGGRTAVGNQRAVGEARRRRVRTAARRPASPLLPRPRTRRRR
jgi:catechol 2,3-dioxygenase-like lactoylglutathione lyase family enzyme